VAFLPLTALAHDFWIDPSTFRPPLGSIVQLRLRVGQNHSGDPVARNNDLIERFVAVGGARTAEVVGRDGGDPGGLVRIDQSGITIVAYRSKPSYVELSPEKLEQYFADEGLESIRALRQEHGESNWLVEAVHFVPTPAGAKGDWESLWASLTFAVPDRAR